jgi:putative ABC transport system permease protein
METILQDLRYAVRRLAQRPGFALMAVLALALGIGANTAIFSLVNTVLLRPVAIEHPERVVMVYSHKRGDPELHDLLSPADFLDWKRQGRIFAALSPAGYQHYNVTGLSTPLDVLGVRVDSDFWKIMTMKPVLGRGLLPAEDRSGAEKVVVLRHSFWQQYLGGDPRAVGRQIKLDGESYTVVGVMPPGYLYPTPAQLWLPAAFTPNEGVLHYRYLYAIGRLAPGISVRRAQADMNLIGARLEQQYPDDKGWGINVLSLRESLVGDTQTSLLVLLAAAALVLLIACTNVASLMLARASTRGREMAIRSALGAPRRRVFRQLLIESLMLSLAGGAAGVVLAAASLKSLLLLLADVIPRRDEVAIDGRVLLATLVLSLLTGILFGLAPALHSSKLNLVSSLKEGKGRSAGGPRSQRPLKAFLVAEVALAVMIMIAAGLLLKSLGNLSAVDPGFVAKDLIMAPVTVPDRLPRYKDGTQQVAFFQRAFERIAAVPGVRKVGAVDQPPLHWPATTTAFVIAGRPAPRAGEEPVANLRVLAGDYFGAMQIPLLRGRAFTGTDGEHAAPVVVINREIADKFWPNADPLGRQIAFNKKTWTIVGIAGNDRERNLTDPITPTIFTADAQAPSGSMVIMVRTAADPAPLVDSVRKAVWSLDPDLPLPDVKPWEQELAEETAEPRAKTTLLGVFAVLALVLAAMGIYGITAFFVAQRTDEIGVRMALGANRNHVLLMIVRQGLVLALVGIAIGLAGAFAVTRVLSSLLFGVAPDDPAVFAGVTLFLLAVAAAASFMPARRATFVDPLVALRFE